MENACKKEIAAVSAAMRVGFAKTPCDWQAKQIRSITCSAHAGVVVHLLVQATGGGKSLVRNAAARALGGARPTVSPLLVLGSDQSSKLKTMTQPGTGVKSAHLDETAAGSVPETKLLQDAENLPSHRRELSSPQRLGSESWTKQLPRVISVKVLKMVRADEAHPHVMHGLHFRPKFFKLKEILFDKMGNSNVPAVFVTVTATEQMIGHIKQLSGGLDVLPENITWPGSEQGVQHRDIVPG